MKRTKKKVHPHKAWQAFNSVLEHYNDFRDWDPARTMKPSNYAAKPMIVDFMSDVDLIILEIIEKSGFNQERIGALFVRRGLHPTSKYFNVERKQRRSRTKE